MTTKTDLDLFKKQYCNNATNRKKMLVDFHVSVASFEEILVGHYINSYATGERKIENSFVILNVVDSINNKTYQPVFSETVAREMLKDTNIKFPRKITVYRSANNCDNNHKNHDTGLESPQNKRTPANAQLLNLIELSRSLMLFKVNNPKLMDGVFKEIYDELNKNPSCSPHPSKIKSINTALGRYIESHGRANDFSNLNNFIDYINKTSGLKEIKQYDFSTLRYIFSNKYPTEKPYF
ncbi:MAG: hypothetical protein NC131_13120 [Roseburia sp.]|nr:hypothetical protein [Roseburia sp.]